MIKPLLIFLIFIWSVSPRNSAHYEQRVGLYDSAEISYFKILDKKVKATVEGPYVEIQYTHTYKNQRDDLVKAEFAFPQAENDIFHKVEIKHENQDIVRLAFEEVNIPGKQYQMKTPDTKEKFLYKKIPVGNVRAYEIVDIIFTVLKPLKVHFNQYYELSLKEFYIFPAHHRRGGWAEIMRVLEREWNVQIELKSEKPFAILANPGFNFQPELSNHTDRLSGTTVYKAFYNVSVHPVHYFTVYFAHSDFHAPQTIMATHPFNPHDHALMFSLVPDMNYFPYRGRYCNSPPFHEEIQPILGNLSDPDNFAKLKKATVQSDLHYFPNEYLFVIDRSDSMKGPPLENLKKTLNKFLSTLSKSASFYSILSFGNSSQLHWKKPEDGVPYKTPENTTEIMKWVETLEANMGDKDLLDALKFAFEEYKWGPLPKNVIILTGEEEEGSNMDEIIQLVQANSHSQKICALEISEYEEVDIIQKIGEAGGCPTEFSRGSEDFDDMPLNIMEATLTPPDFNLAYEIKCLDGPGFAVYQEEGGYEGIPKDRAITKWVTLNNITNLKSCKAKIFYYSQHRCSSSYEEIEIFRSHKAEITDIWHKVADHAKLHYKPQIEEESKRKRMVNNIQEEKSCSLYDIYQEQFKNSRCDDSKMPLLNSGYDPLDSLSRHEERQEESFFLAVVFTLLFVARLRM